jgi:pimeloyl-ACP methyl ester carboxylesterase
VPRLQLKVLAVYGERDAMRADFARLEEGVPRAQFLLIPNAGHACYMDDPKLFNRELLAFLEHEILGSGGGGSGGGSA